MAPPTLAELLDDLIELLEEALETLKRELGDAVLGKLQAHTQMGNFATAMWAPPKTNADTTTSDLAALSVEQLDDWATQNKTEVQRLLDAEG